MFAESISGSNVTDSNITDNNIANSNIADISEYAFVQFHSNFIS